MKLSLATRISIGYAAILLTFGAVSLFGVTALHQNQLEIRLVSQGYLHLAQELTRLETLIRNRQRDLERQSQERNPETRQALFRLADLYYPGLLHEQLKAAQQTLHDMKGLAPATESAFLEEVRKRIDGKVDGDGLTGPFQERDIRWVQLMVENRIREGVERAEHRDRQTGLAILGFSLLAIGVGLLTTALSARWLRPIKTLIEGVSRIGRGDFNAQLGLQGDDEVSLLAREFDHMASSLKERDQQLKEKQEQLLRSEQLAAVGRMSAQIAHEVRNPLSSIGLNVELLQETLVDSTLEVKKVLSSILQEVDHLTDVTEDCLRLTRIPQPSLAPTDVNQIVQRALDFLHAELNHHGVHVDFQLAPSSLRTLADEGQLRQVLLNLIRNSQQAMPRGGTLRLTTQQQAGSIEVTLSDNGPGIPDDLRDKIFEPFFTTKERGSGLGLFVTQQIIQAHHGNIRCDSSPGGGAQFKVTLTALAPE